MCQAWYIYCNRIYTVIKVFMNKEQLEYVRTQLGNGVPPDDLRAVMHEAGYDDEVINDLFAAVQKEKSVSAGQKDNADVPHNEVSTNHIVQLPSFNEFIQKAWAPSFQLFQVAFIGVVGWSVATAALLTFSDDYIVQSLSGWMAALTGLISLYLSAVIVAVILRTDCVSVSDGLKWANKNFASIWWLAILMFLVQTTGLMLLLIPGVVIIAYIALSYPVRVAEGKRGIQAMVRSTALVHGHWWSVFGRLVLLGLTFIPLLIIAFITSTLMSTSFNLDAESVWVDVPFWIVNAIVLTIYSNAISILYTHLVAGRGNSIEGSRSVRVLYIVFAVMAPVIWLVPTVILSSLNDARDSGQRATDLLMLNNGRMLAVLYYNENDLSFDGLCATLPLEVDCEATTDAYRLSLPLGSGEIACIDSVENELVTVTSVPSGSPQCR